MYADPSESRLVNETLPRAKTINDGVVLLVGPVLGPFQLMHDQDGLPRTSVTVLVEFDVDCKAECRCGDVLSGEIYVGYLTVVARRARVMRVAGLRLGRRYLLSILVDGTRKNMNTCFHTPDRFGADFNICILSGHRPTELLPGESDILADVAARLKTPWNGLDVTVHVGFRSSFATALQDVALVLFRDNKSRRINVHHNTTTTITTTATTNDNKTRRALEQHALQRFRDEYRVALSTPAMRAILASSANIFTGCARALLACTSALPACNKHRFRTTETITPGVEDDNNEWRFAVLQAINLALRVSFE